MVYNNCRFLLALIVDYYFHNLSKWLASLLYCVVQIGRSKWNGNVGNSGLVLRVDVPLSTVGRPSFSVQINSGIEF